MSDILQTLCSRLGQPPDSLQSSHTMLLPLMHAWSFPELATHIDFGMSSTCHKPHMHVTNRVQFKKAGYKVITFDENLVWLKPWPEPPALAFSYSEPGQAHHYLHALVSRLRFKEEILWWNARSMGVRQSGCTISLNFQLLNTHLCAWYHYSCMNYDFAPKHWIYPSCKASNTSKRRRVWSTT